MALIIHPIGCPDLLEWLVEPGSMITTLRLPIVDGRHAGRQYTAYIRITPRESSGLERLDDVQILSTCTAACGCAGAAAPCRVWWHPGRPLRCRTGAPGALHIRA